MKRQLLVCVGCIALLAGWMSAFLLNKLPWQSDFNYFLPTILLALGLGLVYQLLGGRLTAVVLALTAVASIVAFNALFSEGRVSLSQFKQRLQQHQENALAREVQVRKQDMQGAFTKKRHLQSSADVQINLFARLPGPARMLATDISGNIYVSIPQLGAIYLLRDTDHNGTAEQPILFHAGLDRPHGLVWDDGRLYVAEPGRLLVLVDSDKDLSADQSRVLVDGLPDDGGHWTRSLAQGADGALYLSIGSRCNACEEADSRRATVLKIDPATGQSAEFARGLRNSVGLAFDATGKQLWASDNGRDRLGDELPPDEINLLQSGKDYGWPYCFGQQIPDPQLGTNDRCLQTLPSSVDLPAHSAPLGIVFGSNLNAPDEFRNSLFVAYHGSWNRSQPTGYKLVRIPFAGGQPSGPSQDFISGWLQGPKAWGRPVAPLVGSDGNLYLSDDLAQAIYRIQWQPGGGK